MENEKKIFSEQDKRDYEKQEYETALVCMEKIRNMVNKGKLPKTYTQADKQFVDNVVKIVLHGEMSGEDVRTVWADKGDARARYISTFGVCDRYDLKKAFPILTIRDCSKQLNTSVDELNWIFIKASNDIHQLNSHIWDQWADALGIVKKTYGYQIAKEILVKTKDGKELHLNQFENVIYRIKNYPECRRIMTNMFDPQDVPDMALAPCAFGTHWLVRGGKLNLVLFQRSQDMLTANGWNVMQYAALQAFVAAYCNLEVGELIHDISDCHIYLRHFPQIVKLFEADDCKDCKPQLVFKNNITDIKTQFVPENMQLVDYEASSVKIGRIYVAK